MTRPIVCHGDSLTEGADVENAYRWASLLENAVGRMVINTGIGGDTTAGLVSRFPLDVVPHKPTAVILMAGTNDLWWDLPLNLVMSNLYTMAYQARHHRIAPVFGMPIPFLRDVAEQQDFRRPESGYEELQAGIGRLVDRMKAAAAGSDIPVLDFHALFLDADGRPRAELFFDDGLHPNREGHRRMARLAAGVLGDLFLLGAGR